MKSNDVIEIFKDITRIPRESGNEKQMTEYLVNFAKEHNLAYKTDEIGNVLIIKEASPGKEKIPAIVLQSHQDMVCEKTPESTHDFEKDPIKYVIEDGWMIAKETTLGADDGIGIAASLALLKSNLPTGKIECLFTISEETGMDGAMALKENFFEGKTLINLDSEDEGQLFVGCAGGLNTTVDFCFEPEKTDIQSVSAKITVKNAMGGHSGDDINKGRANAIKLLSRFLYFMYEKEKSFEVVSVEGGNKYNAIPREASAVILVSKENLGKLKSEVEKYSEIISKEYGNSDSGVVAICENTDKPELMPDRRIMRNVISAMVAVVNGVVAMSMEIENLVETSSNLSFVKTSENKIVVGTSQRSSVDSAKEAVADMIKSCFELAGGKVVRSDSYPGWKPNMKSEILKITFESYKRLFSKEPEVKAIHAGLECGLFLEKFPYLDMISFGPTLRGCHAPGERLDLASNEKFVALLADVVTNFK